MSCKTCRRWKTSLPSWRQLANKHKNIKTSTPRKWRTLNSGWSSQCYSPRPTPTWHQNNTMMTKIYPTDFLLLSRSIHIMMPSVSCLVHRFRKQDFCWYILCRLGALSVSYCARHIDFQPQKKYFCDENSSSVLCVMYLTVHQTKRLEPEREEHRDTDRLRDD